MVNVNIVMTGGNNHLKEASTIKYKYHTVNIYTASTANKKKNNIMMKKRMLS